MANFKVKIQGLEILKKSLSPDNYSAQRLIPEVSLGVLQIHNVLEKRVGELFTNSLPLSSVMIGKSVAPSEIGKTFLKYSLQYRAKAIPLHKYKFELRPSNKISSAPFRLPSGHVVWKKGKYSKEVWVEVRKGKQILVKKKSNKRIKGFSQRGQIFARVGRKTWEVPPAFGEEGIRAGIKLLFGPSLSQLARKVYENDQQVQQVVERVENRILESFIKSYD